MYRLSHSVTWKFRFIFPIFSSPISRTAAAAFLICTLRSAGRIARAFKRFSVNYTPLHNDICAKPRPQRAPTCHGAVNRASWWPTDRLPFHFECLALFVQALVCIPRGFITQPLLPLTVSHHPVSHPFDRPITHPPTRNCNHPTSTHLHCQFINSSVSFSISVRLQWIQSLKRQSVQMKCMCQIAEHTRKEWQAVL